NAYYNGLLIPAINGNGQVVGLQLRKDQPRSEDDRYSWVSTAGKGGTPVTVLRAAPEALNDNLVILSEGLKNAAFARQKWGCHAIALAGVTAYRLEELLKEIDALPELTNVAIAFDADKEEKAQVKKAERKLLRALVTARPDLEYSIVTWPRHLGKGLDDVLLAGSDTSVFKFTSAK